MSPEGELQHTDVEYRQEGDVAEIRFSSPSGISVFSSRVIGALGNKIERIAEDSTIRFVVFRGTGKTFLAGADVKEMAHFTEDQGEAHSRHGQSAFDAIESLPQVTIAALNGHALGGGCELALACDFRLMSAAARIGQPESRLGLIPGWGGTSRLPRLIGPGRARRLLFSGESIPGERAAAIGLVDELVADGEALDAAVCSWCDALRAGSPAAIRRIKQTLREGGESTQFGLCFSCSDAREGIRAFIEKQPPSWARQVAAG